MKALIKMAIKNLLRHRIRSALAITSVALAMMAIVFLQGFIGGMLGNLVDNYTRMETGHLRISSKEFSEDMQADILADAVPDIEVLKGKLVNHPELGTKLKSIQERMRFGVMLNNKGLNKGAFGLAGDPEKEREALLLAQSIISGRYIENEREIILGKALADDLELKTGDEVNLMTQAHDWSLNLRRVKIVGLFESGIGMMDRRIFQLPITDARELLKYGEKGQQLILFFENYRMADKLKPLIQKIVDNDNLAVQSWSEIGDYGTWVAMAGVVYNFIYIVIASLGVLIIANLLLMAVMERRREIGLLGAMGFKRQQIAFIFLAEGSALGLIGTLFGALLGSLIVWPLALNGVDISSMTESFNYPISSRIFFIFSPWKLMNAIFIGLVVSAFISWYPARQAAKMRPVEALRLN